MLRKILISFIVSLSLFALPVFTGVCLDYKGINIVVGLDDESGVKEVKTIFPNL